LEFQIEDGFDDAIKAPSFFDLVGALPFFQSPNQLAQAQNACEFGFRERADDLGIRAAEGFWNFEFHGKTPVGLKSTHSFLIPALPLLTARVRPVWF
jgi:hypothetical protein